MRLDWARLRLSSRLVDNCGEESVPADEYPPAVAEKLTGGVPRAAAEDIGSGRAAKPPTILCELGVIGGAIVLPPHTGGGACSGCAAIRGRLLLGRGLSMLAGRRVLLGGGLTMAGALRTGRWCSPSSSSSKNVTLIMLGTR